MIADRAKSLKPASRRFRKLRPSTLLPVCRCTTHKSVSLSFWTTCPGNEMLRFAIARKVTRPGEMPMAGQRMYKPRQIRKPLGDLRLHRDLAQHNTAQGTDKQPNKRSPQLIHQKGVSSTTKCRVQRQTDSGLEVVVTGMAQQHQGSLKCHALQKHNQAIWEKKRMLLEVSHYARYSMLHTAC